MTEPGGTTAWWQPPAQRSPTATVLLDRIEAGKWRPAESTIWGEPAKAAARYKIHEWEWRNLVVRAYCARQAADPRCPWPVEELPHCPNRVYAPAADRYSGERYLQALCACPEPDARNWGASWYRAHWIGRQAGPLYCHCGGPEEPPGSGIRWVHDTGYVCEACAPLLITSRLRRPHDPGKSLFVRSAGHPGDGSEWSHPLKCDCRCCYCGRTAREGRGWRLTCHPPIAPVTETSTVLAAPVSAWGSRIVLADPVPAGAHLIAEVPDGGAVAGPVMARALECSGVGPCEVSVPYYEAEAWRRLSVGARVLVRVPDPEAMAEKEDRW